jgi:hypothetical protein
MGDRKILPRVVGCCSTHSTPDRMERAKICESFGLMSTCSEISMERSHAL